MCRNSAQERRAMKENRTVFTAMIRNVEAYIQGDILQISINFPTSDDELKTAFAKIHLVDMSGKYYISEYHFWKYPMIKKTFGEYENIRILNMIALLLCRFEPDPQKIDLILQKREFEAEGTTMEELANIIVQSDAFCINEGDLHGFSLYELLQMAEDDTKKFEIQLSKKIPKTVIGYYYGKAILKDEMGKLFYTHCEEHEVPEGTVVQGNYQVYSIAELPMIEQMKIKSCYLTSSDERGKA